MSKLVTALTSMALNSLFLCGAGCIVGAAFMVSMPLGLVVLGVPLVAVSIHIQRKLLKP